MSTESHRPIDERDSACRPTLENAMRSTTDSSRTTIGAPHNHDASARTVIIPRGCNGPPDSAQGGWMAGLIAERVGLAATVTLRSMPPLETPLSVESGCDVVRVRHGQAVVGEGRPQSLAAAAPRTVSWDEALEGRAAYLTQIAPTHPFRTCFGCGPDRSPDNALRIFAGPVPRRDLVAAPWEVTDVLDEGHVSIPLVWAAMDCPTASAFALSDQPEPVGVVLLANLALDIKALPSFGDHCVITAWPLGRAGRKWSSGGALLSPDGTVLATAEALWIEPRSR